MKKYFIFCLVCVFPFVAFAQNAAADLSNDLVKIENGKMTMTDYTLLIQYGITSQIVAYCEAPADGSISRDHFVSLCRVLRHDWLSEMKKDPAADVRTLGRLISKPEAELNVFILKNGVLVEEKTSSGTTRKMMEWDEVLKKG
jgi:hypothetical protein